MKWFAIAAALLLTACERHAQETQPAGDFNVETLFKKDSCTVYRFHDAGDPIYFVICGKGGPETTSWSVLRICGKNCYYRHRFTVVTL